MPLLPHAIKKARQDALRRARRLPYKSRMKTMVGKVVRLAADGKLQEAQAALPQAFRAVDMAAKRHLLHWRTASRKKSRLSRLVSPKRS